MGIKQRLAIAQFLQFFIWGSWLISFGNYMGGMGMGDKIGTLFATAGIASFIMPALTGIVADRWLNAERLLGILHLLGALFLCLASTAADFNTLYLFMFLNALAFMPTIGLGYSVCYGIMAKNGMDPVKAFPPVRSWGTVGFIVAMWLVNLLGWGTSSNQLLLAGGAALLLGLFAFTLPPSPPAKAQKGASLAAILGLDALALLKEKQMAVFFLFAILLGVCLQITNAYGSLFLDGFKTDYPRSFAVQYNNIFMSVSQISEALFILDNPFFFRRFGIKTVMLMSLGAWTLRFALFAVGNPGTGMAWLVLSMVVYGMAFDFFNVSSSLFMEKETPAGFRASAQGILMVATNGFGAVIGNYGAEAVINYHTENGLVNWPAAWFSFAGYAAATGVLFALFFRRKQVRGACPV